MVNKIKGNKMKKSILGLILLFIFTVSLNAVEREGKVLEHIKAGGYSYLKLDQKGELFWAAIPQADIKLNDVIKIKEQMWMNDFESKSLNKVFDKILFASYSENPYSKHDEQRTESYPSLAEALKVHEPKADLNQESLVTTINEIKSKKNEFKDKKISLEGEVIKVLRGIMKTSWVHIMDKDGNKLIFRAAKEAVEKGDKVIATGIVNVDVDYGYGYTYELIVADSSFKKLNN